ncbi:MAG: hypothetical protein WCH46_09295 [bacterium]
MNKKYAILLIASTLLPLSKLAAQTNGGATDQSQATILSARLSTGFGIGRARESLGANGSDAVWWSTGQGMKLDAALDLPLLPVEMLNSGGDENDAERNSVIGIELELGSGYHFSTGGKYTSGSQTVSRTYCYVPLTLGFNVRASFGAGSPSIYIGAGGGTHWKCIYEDNITIANSSTTILNKYDPPLPFELYGQLGLEIPLLYTPEDGNSLMDLFIQARFEEATNYIYDYESKVSTPSATSTTVVTVSGAGHGESASNVAFALGIKFNIY